MVSPELLISTPVQAKATLVLTHGAGGGMRGNLLDTVSEGLTDRGWCVVRFEFPYATRRALTGRQSLPDKLPILLETYRSVVDTVIRQVQKPLLIGGHSMGGRIASLLGDTLYSDGLIHGVVSLGYPFHPLRKPDHLRTDHLRFSQVPMLIVQGERDPMGGCEEVQHYDLSDQIQIRWIPDGDHSFLPRKRSGFTDDQNLRHVVRCVDAFMIEVCNR